MARQPKDKKWIQGAIKNPGSFTAKAKRAGAVTSRGTISPDFIESAKRSPNPTTRKQAVLAETLGRLSRSKRKK